MPHFNVQLQTTKCLLFLLRNVTCLLFPHRTECKFHCTNGNCLRLGSLICNQLNNCGDNSDEENCPVVTQHPPPGIFNCECCRMLLHICVSICLPQTIKPHQRILSLLCLTSDFAPPGTRVWGFELFSWVLQTF